MLYRFTLLLFIELLVIFKKIQTKKTGLSYKKTENLLNFISS